MLMMVYNKLRYVCLFLLLLFTSRLVFACDEIINESILDNYSKWSVLNSSLIGNKIIKGDSIELSPERFFAGRIDRTYNIRKNIGNVLVVRVLTKSAGIISGDKGYQQAQIVVRFKDRRGKKKYSTTNFSGSFGWGYEFAVLNNAKGSGKLYISLRNEALKGIVSFKSIQVFSCKKSDIGELDYPVNWVGKTKDALTRKVKLDIPGSKTWPRLNKRLNGYNIGGVGDFRNIAAILDDDKVKNLGIQLYRYPDGISANFYHWKFDGYDPSDLSSFPVFNNEGTRRFYAKYSSGKSTTERSNLFSYVKKNKIPVSLVLNVLTSKNIGNQEKFVKLTNKLSGGITNIELGNELYLKGQQGSLIDGATDYIHNISALLKKLNKDYPDIPVGIPVNRYKGDWNKKLEESGLHYDAVITHPYINVASIASVVNDQILLRYSSTTVPKIFNYLGNSFPGKQIWVTEWNFEDRPYRRLATGPISVGFSANMMVSMLQNNKVKIANFYSLFAPRLGIFSLKNNKNPVIKVKYQPAYKFLATMGKLFYDMSETIRVNGSIADNKGNINEPLRVQAFKNKKIFYLLLINNSINKIILNSQLKPNRLVKVKNWALSRLSDKLNKCSGNCVITTKEDVNKLIIPPVSVVVAGPFMIDWMIKK